MDIERQAIQRQSEGLVMVSARGSIYKHEPSCA